MPQQGEQIAEHPRRPSDQCPHCGYATVGLKDQTCPECGAHLGGDPESPAPAPKRVSTAPDIVLTLACATFGLSLSFIACELSFRIWIDWLILWPFLAVIGVPVFAWFALERPRTAAAVALAAALAWMLMSHTEVYAYLLVHWVRSPGVPGSKGLEPETIKPLFRYGGAALLLLTAALTATTGGRHAAR